MTGSPKPADPAPGQAEPSGAPRYLTLAEVAADLQVSPRWLRELVRDKGLPVLRKGRMVRFDDLALRALEETLRSPAKPAAARTMPARSASIVPMDPEAAYAAALKATTPARKPPRAGRPTRSALS